MAANATRFELEMETLNQKAGLNGRGGNASHFWNFVIGAATSLASQGGGSSNTGASEAEKERKAQERLLQQQEAARKKRNQQILLYVLIAVAVLAITGLIIWIAKSK